MSEPEDRSSVSQTDTDPAPQLARQSLGLLSSGVVGYVLSLVMGIILARSLGPVGYGGWVIAFSIANTIAVFGLLGGDWLLVRHGSQFQDSGDTERLRRTIHVALALSAVGLLAAGGVVIITAPMIAAGVFGRPELTGPIRMAGLLGPVLGAGSILLYGTQAFRQVRQIAVIRNIVGPTGRVVAVAVAAMLGASAVAALFAILIAELVVVILAGRALFTRIRLTGPTRSLESGAVLAFAVPAWGTRLVETARAQLFPVLLGAMSGPAAAGVFSIGRRISSAPGSVIATINRVYSPIASALYLGPTRERFAEAYKSVGRWSFALGLPVFCITVLFPSELLGLFGPAYRAWSGALMILAVGMLVNSATGPVTTTLIVSGRARLAFVDYMVALVLEIVLGFLLIPRLGVTGAAIARAVGTATNNIMPMVQIWRADGVHPYDRSYFKPIGAAVGASVAAIAVVSLVPDGSTLSLVVGASVLSVTYVGLLLGLGLPPVDRAAARSILGGGGVAVKRLFDPGKRGVAT